MLEPHRRVHFRLWLLLAAIVPLLLLATFVMRPQPGEGASAQRLGSAGEIVSTAGSRGRA